MSKISNNDMDGMNSSYGSMGRKVPTHPTKLRVMRGSQSKLWNHPHLVSNSMGGIIQTQQVHEQLPCLRYVYDPSRPPRTSGIGQDQSGELRASPTEKRHTSTYVEELLDAAVNHAVDTTRATTFLWGLGAIILAQLANPPEICRSRFKQTS
ncbi:uncharacterized protein APUU_80146S [Aspergillus puulaauensis]|uniref:Uncharacterized protein n=1 Tax=Aspergillus puulaauensis TaxID=1220207 RepID=A0A7R8AUF3_9EURO|nr:uncharacterized protein APUU_80146S [Aspergillus puulaauensis]BCS29843.1 hypothetical protein APUU_80146S [Aspergillus puulaauensis]